MVAYLRKDNSAGYLLNDLESRDVEVTTTPVNTFELFKGAWGSENSENNIRAVARFLSGIRILEFDTEASFRAGRISSELKKQGVPIGVEDTLIAGIVMRHEERLLTRNLRHFEKIRGLRTLSW